MCRLDAGDKIVQNCNEDDSWKTTVWRRKKKSEDNINIKFDLWGKCYDDESELFQHRVLKFASASALATFEILF
jgi:hypothetical protein